MKKAAGLASCSASGLLSFLPRANNMMQDLHVDSLHKKVCVCVPCGRFLLFLMRKDPLMEFTARPIPPDKWSTGVPEQAR